MRSLSFPRACACAALLLACATLSMLGFGTRSAVGDAGSFGVVAQVGETGIMPADLARWWFDRTPGEYRKSLDALVDERIARAAAARLGLHVPELLLRNAVTREVEARKQLQQKLFGVEARLEDWVREAYGVDLQTWRFTMLRPRIESLLLQQRLIRLDGRRRARVHARVIVVSDFQKAQQLSQKLRRGADFSLVALKESEDQTKRVGGALPPISAGDLAAYPHVERSLLAAAAGALLGPLEVTIKGKRSYHLYKVVRREEPWRMQGAALFEALEKDLLARPVTEAERARWRGRLRAAGRVRYFRPDGSIWEPPNWR